MKYFLFTFIFLSQVSVHAKRMVYANKPYVQMHQNKSRFSRIISNFECNQPFQVLKDEGEFMKVKFATYQGYILSDHLQRGKFDKCYQDQYRKFIDYLDLGVSDMHYWGRLQDLYVSGEVNP